MDEMEMKWNEVRRYKTSSQAMKGTQENESALKRKLKTTKICIQSWSKSNIIRY